MSLTKGGLGVHSLEDHKVRRSHVEMRSRRELTVQSVSEFGGHKDAPVRFVPPPKQVNAMHDKLRQLKEKMEGEK